MKKLKYFLVALAILAAGFFAFRFYTKQMAVTKVAFINYQGFQLSRINKSNTSDWVKIESLSLDELDQARDYSAIFIFGRGFQMSPDQMEQLNNAGYSGVNLFVESATNPNVDVTNLKGATLDVVTDYFKYGGTQNYQNLLAYVRKEMDGKKWFAKDPLPPKPIPSNVFLHLDEEKVFEDFDTYNEYLLSEGHHKKGQPKIALITSVPGPFNSNRDHIDAFINMLSERGYNVYTISANTKRLDFLKDISPDLAVLMPHGRLTLGQSDEAINWLSNQNIPLLTPLSVFQEYDKWVKDPQGFAGALLTMNVVLPELDGGVNPYAIIAQYKDDEGYLSFKPIPDRMEKFGNMVDKWMTLKTKANKDKKIAIYYFKGPGLNAMVAANMEVVPSIYNTLKRLEKEGYNVGQLPASADELWEQIKQQGAVLGPYAQGAFDEFLENGNPELIEKSTYESWVKQDLKPEIYQDVVERYGGAPGDYMSVYKNGKDYLAVARLQFGNVVILPQPLPGIGEDTFSLVHGADVAPPHTYIASYLWTRNSFQADAIIHYGTHGSLEFTPGKQVALSEYDWTDALISVTPHFYVYTISNVGEGIIAKRRSYATTVSYLTPPFMESDVSGELKELSDKLKSFVSAQGAVKEQYRQSITSLVRSLDIHKDLALDSVGLYTDDIIFKVSNHVEEVRNAKVTGGLYTVGNAYSTEQINNTVGLMALDPVAYRLSALDKLKGIVSQKQLDNQVYFDLNYRQKAKRVINNVLLKGHTTNRAISSVVSKSDLEQARNWAQRKQGPSDADIIKGFISMGESKQKSHPHAAKSKETSELSDKQLSALQELVIKVAANPEEKEYITSLKSDKQFKQATGVLDPKTLERAKTIAKAIPAMAQALEISERPHVFELIKQMQDEKVRAKTFELLANEDLAVQVKQETERLQQNTIDRLTQAESIKALSLVQKDLKGMNKHSLNSALTKLKSYKAAWPVLVENKPGKLKAFLDQPSFEQELSKTIDAIDLAILSIENDEAAFATAVLNIESALANVLEYKQKLIESTEAELSGIVNGLNGGYIVPSAGGDPITNPATLPTGRNLYSIDAEKTPSPEAWVVGKRLAENLIETHLTKHGEYPKKISFTLWPGDFIETEGAMIGQIFYLLGVEPVRDPFNRVVDVKLIPANELGRPRIDVVVQTAGQFRDLAASRMFMINKAVKMAAQAEDADNFVKEGVLAAESLMKEQGISPVQAREWSTQRVFGGVNGNYGTNIMGMVEQGNAWESEKEVAETYLNNMGAIYDEGENWGAFQKGVFQAALQNTEVVVQPRQSNTWGGLSLDHVYEFMGGLSMAVRHVTGEDPDAYFNDFRNPVNAKVQGLKEALWVEARSTLLNPKYINEYMEGGATSAETFAETFRNTYGWNVMKPNEIDNELWDNLHDVYVKDKLGLGVHEFFERENPYALEEMTAVMLETVRKGYWKATEQQIQELTQLHTELIQEFKPGCSGFVCNNDQLQQFISEQLTEEASAEYAEAIKQVRESAELEDSMVLEEEKLQERNEKSEADDSQYFVVVVLVGLFLLLVLAVIIRKKRQS